MNTPQSRADRLGGDQVALTMFVLALALAGCTTTSTTAPARRVDRAADDPEIVIRHPHEGETRWVAATGANELGAGAEVKIKIDRVSVPSTPFLVATERLAEQGILPHQHTAEDELVYVVRGRGFAVVGPDQQQVPIEVGSILYVPAGGWHGFRNADPVERMEILFITSPAKKDGLGDFMRYAIPAPGEAPLQLSPEELVKLLNQYGMRVPEQDAAAPVQRDHEHDHEHD